jgi:parallel beta-helix repeat protein
MDGGEFMYRLHIEGCDVGNCGQDGIFFETSGGNLYCEVINNVIYSCGLNGIRVVAADYSIIQGNICILNGGDGIELESTAHSQIQGNICFQNAEHGILLNNADYCSVEGNTCVENDSGDTATYDGINVDAASTRNNVLGNICTLNHRYGIYLLGAGNSVNSNVVAENDRHGIYLDASDCKANDNLCYHNGADADNAYHGIRATADADRCTINGNTCYSDGVRQQGGIHFENGASDCTVNDNICYNHSRDGIRLAANNDDCVITGNHCLSNGAYGINIANANCMRNRVKDNILRGNGTLPIQDLGTGTQLETIPIPLIQGTAFISGAGVAWGWEIDLTTEFALGIGWLPWETQQVVRIQIKGVALAAPGAGNSMRIEITGDGGTFDEGFATEPIDVADHPSEEDSFAINDVISWVIDAADEPNIGDLLGGDRLQLKLLHEDAGGGDIATDVIIDSIQVEIV